MFCTGTGLVWYQDLVFGYYDSTVVVVVLNCKKILKQAITQTPIRIKVPKKEYHTMTVLSSTVVKMFENDV